VDSLAPFALGTVKEGSGAATKADFEKADRMGVGSTLSGTAGQGHVDSKHKDGAINRLRAQLVRFRILKVNKIHKNTPRLLELDLTSKLLTIGKKRKGDMDSSFSQRDIVITCETLLGAELSEQREQLLSLTYQLPMAASEAKLSAAAAAAAAQQRIKTWKILFDSREDRERFFRLLQINMLSRTRQQATASVSSALTIPLPGSAGAGRPYYVPRPLQHSRRVETSVRQLPVPRLAAQLHSSWMLQRTQQGWKYGKDMDDVRKTHPNMVPFKQLQSVNREDTVRIVTQTLASVLALGFVIQKQADDV